MSLVVGLVLLVFCTCLGKASKKGNGLARQRGDLAGRYMVVQVAK